MATRFYSAVEYGNRSSNGDPDCVYYNANIINNSTADSVGIGEDPQVTFSESRQTPILRDPTDFMMSVVQTSYIGATQNLPIFIPRIQTSAVQAQFTGTITSAVGGVATLTVNNILSGSLQTNLPIAAVAAPGQEAVLQYPVAGFTGNGGPGTYKVTASTFGDIPNAITFTQVFEQNDVDLTVYSVTVENLDANGNVIGSSRQFLKWVAPNKYQQPPAPPVLVQNVSSDYYYAYSYQTVLDMVNVAVNNALTAAGVAIPANYSALVYSASEQVKTDPIFIWNFVPNCNFYMNTQLEVLLGNFPGFYLNQDNGRSFRLTSSFQNGTINPSIQSYGSTSSWNPVTSLTITSNMLPISLEQCATPAIVGASSIDLLGTISPGTYLPVVADDVIDTTPSGAGAIRQSFLNEPMGEYRMISLTNMTSPIQQIDFQVWWRSRIDNRLYPLRLVPGSSVSLKVLFRRKQMGR
jgi:hypothetical protein